MAPDELTYSSGLSWAPNQSTVLNSIYILNHAVGLSQLSRTVVEENVLNNYEDPAVLQALPLKVSI